MKCVSCQSTNIVRYGKNRSVRITSQRYKCSSCSRLFQGKYRYKACKQDLTSKIDKLTDQGLSIRKIAKKLEISPTTVHKIRKELASRYQQVIEEPYPVPTADMHLVCWSGGKDSSALLVWALEHLPLDKTKFVFCDTGWEAAETYEFIEDVNARVLDNKLIVLKSQRYDDLPDLARKKQRFPSPRARFCTMELKAIPTMDFIIKHQGNVAVYQGIRAGESAARALMKPQDDYFYQHLLYKHNPFINVNGHQKKFPKPPLYKEVIEWLENYNCSVHRPFFYWKTADILALCRKHNVLNPLYDAGFQRVGCFPCIMSNKSEIGTLATHAPLRIDLVEQLENDIGSTFFPYSKVPDRQCLEPKIRDVIKWANEAPYSSECSSSCMSHYSQCE